MYGKRREIHFCDSRACAAQGTWYIYQKKYLVFHHEIR